MLLDRNDEGIKSGCTTSIVHKKANPSPPNEKPVTNKPKNIIENTFQHLLVERATEPNKIM